MPYYLIFYPEDQELTLFRHGGRKYRTVRANAAGRFPIPELDTEVALLDGWVRYWYKGELLPLPADLQRDLDAARREAEAARREAEEQRGRADQAENRAQAAERELEELRARLAATQGKRNNSK